MNIWLAIPGLLLTFYLLKIVSDEVENSFSALAFKYKIPATIAGATLLAVGGSAGELFTALNSAIFYKTFEIGIVTIIWSAIFNLFVITGLVGIKSEKPIPLAQKGMIRDMLFYFIAALSLAISIFDGKISRTESLFFLIIYAIYLFVLYNGKRDKSELEKLPEIKQSNLKIILVAVFGLAGIAFLSWAMIKFGLDIAKFAGLSIAAVSAMFFAFGTSISDTFIALSAAKDGNGSGAISSVFGSNTFDILVGLGLPITIVNGVPIDADGVFSSMVMLFISIIVAIIFIAHDWHISKREGYALLTFFFIFLGYFLWN